MAAALLGAVGGKLMPAKFKTGGVHGASDRRYGTALIDDDTPTPEHARFTWAKLSLTVLIFFLIWAGAMALLALFDLFQMGGFFTKAAFLTLGGAYAVLPYCPWEVGRPPRPAPFPTTCPAWRPADTTQAP